MSGDRTPAIWSRRHGLNIGAGDGLDRVHTPVDEWPDSALLSNEVAVTIIAPHHHRLFDRGHDEVKVAVSVEVSSDRTEDLHAKLVGAEYPGDFRIEMLRVQIGTD